MPFHMGNKQLIPAGKIIILQRQIIRAANERA
jgi:hypothetical protein